MTTREALCLLAALIIFLGGAACTYSRPVRESWGYWPVFALLSLAGSAVWVIGTRASGGTASIMLFSLAWDATMLLAYYGYPALIGDARLTWQQFAALVVAVGGMVAFKLGGQE